MKKKRIFKWLKNTVPYVRSKHPDDFQVIKDSILYRLKELVIIKALRNSQFYIGDVE